MDVGLTVVGLHVTWTFRVSLEFDWVETETQCQNLILEITR